MLVSITEIIQSWRSVSNYLYLDYEIDITKRVSVYFFPFFLDIKANFLSSFTSKIILEIVVTTLFLILKVA